MFGTHGRPRLIRTQGRGTATKRLVVAATLALAWPLAGCSPERVAGSGLPPNIPDPGLTHTPAGAIAAYYGALLEFRTAVAGETDSYVPVTGLFTDELGSGEIGLVGQVDPQLLADSRNLTGTADNGLADQLYRFLQRARGQVDEARGLVRAYDPDSSALVGHLDVIEGFTDVYLADFFCSGIPLSTVDYNGDYTLMPGSTTAQVYTEAAALFDSALALAAGNDRVLNAARVGLGRAQLALGNYNTAAQAVQVVPNGFSYALAFDTVVPPVGFPSNDGNRNFAWTDLNPARGGFTGYVPAMTMVDREGGNGLPFTSRSDPRTPFVPAGTNQYGFPIALPARLDPSGNGPIVVASGVEARLIEAEAALQAGDPTWLVRLNALRTDGTFTTAPDSVDSTRTDTAWNAGSGGVAGLAPLADPGTTGSKVDLLFRERGFWLFLTGHRQGDLRRLIRQYGRAENAVYPSGSYPGAHGSYGVDVTAPIPIQERETNPYFSGCFSRGG